jgi:hypothetical protein
VPRHVDGIGRGVDRAVVGQPLHWLARAGCAEPRLDALDDQVTDHLAGDACRGDDPADGVAVVGNGTKRSSLPKSKAFVRKAPHHPFRRTHSLVDAVNHT